MLSKFSVKNYRGFKNRIEWDLLKYGAYEFNKELITNSVIKNGIIYGHNGSGKTNLGLAIFDITNHFGEKFKKPDYYTNYIYAGNQTEPVRFEYEFIFGEEIVKYQYSKQNIEGYVGVILEEKLFKNDKMVFSYLYKRSCELCDEFKVNEIEKKKLIDNSNHIPILNYIMTHFPIEKDSFIIKTKNFVNSMLWFRSVDNGAEFMGKSDRVELIEKFIIDEKLEDEFSSFLKELSGQNYEFTRQHYIKNEKSIFNPLMCKIDGGVIPFSLVKSTGTNSLLILFYWYKHIQDASFVFVDEFDAFYHFELSLNVCRKLFKLNCQLFLTTHNTMLLSNEILRPDCGFLLDNNEIKPLNECTEKELRFGHNMEKLFRGGAFTIR